MQQPSEKQPSQWQKNIEGAWYGIPSMFDVEGNQVGFIKVNRASVFADGRTTYTMQTELDVTGPLRARFEAQGFAFGVQDADGDRVYLGPDFMGAGHPFGTLVDAHYYSPGWTADLRTLVHILPDGKTQVYSSQLYDGPALVSVFNGVYKVAHDYDANPSTRASIDAHVAAERQAGGKTHVLPLKREGTWRGEVAVYSANQQPLGTSHVVMQYRPVSLLRAEMEIALEGAITRRHRFMRARTGNRHAFEGPDVWGNAISYGRALYTSQHFFGEARKVRGREFLIDDDNTLSVVWHQYRSDRLEAVLYGVLQFEPGREVLAANYDGKSAAR